MKSVQVNEVPENAQLIDVREPDEFSEVHAKNAVNLPLSNFAALSEEIDYEQPIYVICKSGGRSAEASQFLEDVRGTEAINVEGGTQAWVNAGLPTE
ncbi:rhodanese-like domain-containing protein [Corynebacterium sp. Marseille-P3884]|uniref:rhodanese-like domain-containing protein n=1 Tax=Corynebacterium sp. Marseille-P3884 TaxID=2495409 RepID=UPI001B332B8B|nr:rhodanese-like domain-containing protein [Corynebacterium sp. Marseille-P3884]MBP3949427.1 rhodanese-like domain-containing protein [Corynebacterium sp. Marseille-P3884]